MPKGWTVAVRRRPRSRSTEGELWDCAIPSAEAAEKAVRKACDPQGVILITARTQLTAHEVDELGLHDGQIRKRPALRAEALPVDG